MCNDFAMSDHPHVLGEYFKGTPLHLRYTEDLTPHEVTMLEHGGSLLADTSKPAKILPTRAGRRTNRQKHLVAEVKALKEETLRVLARAKIIEEMAKPDNRPVVAKVAAKRVSINLKSKLYSFTAAELHEMETEALKIRRTRYAAHLSEVDRALLRDAAEPGADASTRKLAYQRFEGWQEKGSEKSGDFGDALARALVDRMGQDRKEAPIPVGEYKELPAPEGGSC